MTAVVSQLEIERTVNAVPYPWPYHGALDPTHTALVACVDHRWRGGSALVEPDERLSQMASALRSVGGVVISITATPPRNDHLMPLPLQASNLYASDNWLGADVVLKAGATSAFFASQLDHVLRQSRCTDLLIAGWGLEGPVHSTLRSANDRGYECLLVPDASQSLESDLTVASCEMVRFSGGIFGAFANTADVLNALNISSLSRSE